MPTKKPAAETPASSPGAFGSALARWFSREGKDYPWRRTRDPYAVLVSEIMLQQTQVATVLGRGYYTGWLERFPDAGALAAADEQDVLKAWEGLGYYSRARNLQKAAAAIVRDHGGEIPCSLEAIRALPGVGRYTAGAVASFAFDLPEPAVDANIARVLARLFDYSEEITSSRGQKQLWEWAEALVPPEGGRVFNSSMMELGQQVCTPRAPACGDCPVATFCQAEDPQTLPRKKAKTGTVYRDEFALYAVSDGHLLLHQEGGKRRRGLWKLPERPPAAVRGLPLVTRLKYGITHFRVTLHVHRSGDARAAAGEEWHPMGALADLPMASPYRRALDAISADGDFSMEA